MKKKLMILLPLLTIIVGVGLYFLFFYVPENCTTYDGAVAEVCAHDYEGMDGLEAIDKAEANGLIPVLYIIEGKQINDTNVEGTPIYLELKDGTVAKATFADDYQDE